LTDFVGKDDVDVNVVEVDRNIVADANVVQIDV
jgi:hypothetical protein